MHIRYIIIFNIICYRSSFDCLNAESSLREETKIRFIDILEDIILVYYILLRENPYNAHSLQINKGNSFYPIARISFDIPGFFLMGRISAPPLH